MCFFGAVACMKSETDKIESVIHLAVYMNLHMEKTAQDAIREADNQNTQGKLSTTQLSHRSFFSLAY